MSIRANIIPPLSILLILLTMMTACATTHRLHPPVRAEDGVHRLVEIVGLGTREDIVTRSDIYTRLRDSGIDDTVLQDGSVGVGRSYCCGGAGEDFHMWFYVPADLTMEPGDIVEIKMGRVPRGGDLGTVNRAVRVRHTRATMLEHCRWEPPEPLFWMRVLHCDWMEHEGWIEKKGLRHTWLKMTSSTGK